jgi:hypothetical protein
MDIMKKYASKPIRVPLSGVGMKRTALIAIFLSMLWQPTFSQTNSVLRQLSKSGLVQEDINIMARAARQLYVAGNATVGDDTIWMNPATDAHGMAEVIEVRDGCVRIAHKFHARGKRGVQVVTIRRCPVEGRWRLSP